MSKLFAFNLAEDTAPIQVTGAYDEAQQLWIGAEQFTATYVSDTGTGSTGTGTCNPCDCDSDNSDSDYDGDL
jgi:hypothetical protein